jgi:hypothetical protein
MILAKISASPRQNQLKALLTNLLYIFDSFPNAAAKPSYTTASYYNVEAYDNRISVLDSRCPYFNCGRSYTINLFGISL